MGSVAYIVPKFACADYRLSIMAEDVGGVFVNECGTKSAKAQQFAPDLASKVSKSRFARAG